MTNEHDGTGGHGLHHGSASDEVADFWSGQRDWSDQLKRVTGRHARFSDRLRTGVQAVFDAGATSAVRTHSRDAASVPPTPAPRAPFDDAADEPIERTSEGLSIGELALPWTSAVHESTREIPRVNVAVAERPPAFDGADAAAGVAATAIGGMDALDDDVLSDGFAPSDGFDVSDDDGADWGDEWAPETHEVPPERTGVDPLVIRFGAVAVVLTLIAALVLGLREDSDDRVAADATATTLGAVLPVPATERASDGVAEEDAGSSGGDTTSGASEAADAAATTAGSADAAAEPACSTEYTVAEGDYWLRLSDAAGVSLADLLGANGATIQTPLYPGETICLPAGATTPAPPPAPEPEPVADDAAESEDAAAAAPASASGQASSASSGSSSSNSSSSRSNRSQPAATTPPTTAAPVVQTPPPPPPPAAPAEVEQLIRSIFPADQVDKALAVAWRESNYRADVYNGWCCYGVFQIYWSVHQSWLGEFGINSASDLYDAEKNIRAAYALYQRSGGWGPWGG